MSRDLQSLDEDNLWVYVQGFRILETVDELNIAVPCVNLIIIRCVHVYICRINLCCDWYVLRWLNVGAWALVDYWMKYFAFAVFSGAGNAVSFLVQSTVMQFSGYEFIRVSFCSQIIIIIHRVM